MLLSNLSIKNAQILALFSKRINEAPVAKWDRTNMAIIKFSCRPEKVIKIPIQYISLISDECIQNALDNYSKFNINNQESLIKYICHFYVEEKFYYAITSIKKYKYIYRHFNKTLAEYYCRCGKKSFICVATLIKNNIKLAKSNWELNARHDNILLYKLLDLYFPAALKFHDALRNYKKSSVFFRNLAECIVEQTLEHKKLYYVKKLYELIDEINDKRVTDRIHVITAAKLSDEIIDNFNRRTFDKKAKLKELIQLSPSTIPFHIIAHSLCNNILQLARLVVREKYISIESLKNKKQICRLIYYCIISKYNFEALLRFLDLSKNELFNIIKGVNPIMIYVLQSMRTLKHYGISNTIKIVDHIGEFEHKLDKIFKD